jgi:anti-sigma regulatory factor (Ser/Thr protein kinase)
VFVRRYAVGLEPSPESARKARRFFGHVAERAHLTPEQRRHGELAVSELVTNAVVHAQSPIELRARAEKGGLRVEIADCDPRAPHMGDPGPEVVGSRGLPIVAALAAEWGWDSDQDEEGKRVWFTLSRRGRD